MKRFRIHNNPMTVMTRIPWGARGSMKGDSRAVGAWANAWASKSKARRKFRYYAQSGRYMVFTTSTSGVLEGLFGFTRIS